MQKLTEKAKKEIDNNRYFKKCCLCSITGVKIDIHHNLIFAGKQVGDIETLMPLCQDCHDKARRSEVKELLDLLMYQRMTDAQFVKYDKVGYIRTRYRYLMQKYG